MLAGTVILATVATAAGYAVEPEPPMIEYRETVSVGDTIAAAVIIDSLYRNGCPESLIKMMANRDPEIRKMVIYAMRKCFFERVKEGMES